MLHEYYEVEETLRGRIVISDQDGPDLKLVHKGLGISFYDSLNGNIFSQGSEDRDKIELNNENSTEENKVFRIHLELGQVRQNIDKRITENEEEFENICKDSMHTSLKFKLRAKAAALKIKKKLEASEQKFAEHPD